MFKEGDLVKPTQEQLDRLDQNLDAIQSMGLGQFVLAGVYVGVQYRKLLVPKYFLENLKSTDPNYAYSGKMNLMSAFDIACMDPDSECDQRPDYDNCEVYVPERDVYPINPHKKVKSD